MHIAVVQQTVVVFLFRIPPFVSFLLLVHFLHLLSTAMFISLAYIP
jgi:hypothetical protein